MSLDVAAGSQRRPVVVLFADIAGFTAMAEKLDPEQVTDAMNAIIAALVQEVAAVGGHVDKVVGDEIMALFGAPTAHEDDALRAVRAALGMQRVMRDRQDAFQRLLGNVPHLRVGVHGGVVVWGRMDPTRPAEFTVMGDVVNVASRLQRAAPLGGILVSDTVYRRVRGVYLAKAWEPLVVKGKAEPLAVFEILGQREHAEAMSRPPFVNRAADLRDLADLLARAQRGRAQVAVVVGDPGVGKTRLIEEFVATLPPDVGVLQAACPPYGGQSLAPLASLFRQLTGLAGTVSVEDVAARIALGERTPQAAVILSRLFGLAEAPRLGEAGAGGRGAVSPATRLGEAGAGGRGAVSPLEEGVVSHETALLVAAEAIRRLLTRPTLVWIEDLQWADAGTREVLPFMVERMGETPMLLVATLRAGEDPLTWGKRTALTRLQLEPLDETDARRLVGQVLGGPLPPAVERVIIEKAGGNPFYLSEILATLTQTQTLVRDDRGRWSVTAPVEKVLPDTVQSALLARLDRLPGDVRDLVQQAAIIGTTFRQSLLAALRPGDDIPARLRQLEEAYIIRSTDPLAEDPEYLFVHPLLREVAYSSLLNKHQVVLHLQVAQVLERLYPDRRQDLAKTIGTHFDRAGRPDLALGYLTEAGRQAAQRYATREAIELLERVRDLAQGGGDRELCVEACELLGELYRHVQDRGPKQWFAAWQSVLDSLSADADPVRRARAALRAADARSRDNQTTEAWVMLSVAEPLIPAGHPLWSDYHAVRAYTLILESRYEEALAAARAAVKVAEGVGSLADQSRAYTVLAHPAILPLLGEAGRQMMRAWLAKAEASGDERLLVDARHFLTSDMWTRGVVDADLLRIGEEGLRKTQEFGWTRDETTVRALLAWGNFLTGRWAEADEHLGHALALIEAAGYRMQGLFHIILPFVRGNLAMGYGRLADARRIFEEALETARFHAPIWLSHDLARCLLMLGGIPEAEAAMARALEARDRLRCLICGCQANGVAAEFYAALGRPDAAAPAMEAAERTATEIGHQLTRIRVRRARARLALREGRQRAAVEAAREALAIGEEIPVPQPYEDAQTWLLLGQAYAADAPRDAAAAYEEARTRFAALGASWHLGQVDAVIQASALAGGT